MQQGHLNWADFNGLLAVLIGVICGIAGSASRGVRWPPVTLFAVCGFGVGIASAKSIGRIAYACLDRACLDRACLDRACLDRADSVLWGIGYLLFSFAMPTVSSVVSFVIPAATLARLLHSPPSHWSAAAGRLL